MDIQLFATGGMTVAALLAAAACRRTPRDFWARAAARARGEIQLLQAPPAPAAPAAPAAPNSDYPFIFNIDSLQDLLNPSGENSGWSVIYQASMHSTLFQGLAADAPELKGCMVAMIGAAGVGKTWFINRFCGTNLPSGMVVSTLGIGFVQPLTGFATKGVPVILMDSPGTNAPVRTAHNGSDQEGISNRMISNHIVSEVMMRFADSVILVVQQMSSNDQLIISRLSPPQDQSRGSELPPKRQPIIVLHNFFDAHSVQDGLERFAQVARLYADIRGIYMEPWQKPHNSGLTQYFHFETQRHLFLVNDNTAEGRQFNDIQLQELAKWIKSSSGLKSFTNIAHQVCEVVNEVLPGYIIPEAPASSQAAASEGQAAASEGQAAASEGQEQRLTAALPVVYPDGWAYRKSAEADTGAEPHKRASLSPSPAPEGELIVQEVPDKPGFQQVKLTLRALDQQTFDQLAAEDSPHFLPAQLAPEFMSIEAMRPLVRHRHFKPKFDIVALGSHGVLTSLKVIIEIAGVRHNDIEWALTPRVVGPPLLSIRGKRDRPEFYQTQMMIPSVTRIGHIEHGSWVVDYTLPPSVSAAQLNEQESHDGILVFDCAITQVQRGGKGKAAAK
eukprot:TRINITY_DN4278_c0_g1_i2.p1 TRINITY_DN4278_c0_g1~~TRINITY_DN4278_c0_g1_i2.p1  ORF type:complete len:615 (+),score=140.90 TRINITY_DN4278_c0_g1_i2:91-1935(+)